VTRREPVALNGRYGTTSNFGSLEGWTLAEAEAYLSAHPDLLRNSETAGGYHWFVFQDGSEIHIRPNGQLVRLPHRTYTDEGRRITWLRINIFSGEVLNSQVWHQLERDQQEWVIMP
jgi:hypothetical protein